MAEMLVDCAARFAGHEERIKDCESYQKRNNGAIIRMADDIKDMRDANQKSKDLTFRMILGLYALIISGLWALYMLR